MSWTTVSMPTAMAEANDVTPYIALQGTVEDAVGHVKDNYVDPADSSVYIHEHDSYDSAMEFLFASPTYTEAIGQTTETVEVDDEKLTVVLEEDR
jgi:hypothetical protein